MCNTVHISCASQPAYPVFSLLQISPPPLRMSNFDQSCTNLTIWSPKGGGRINIHVFIKRRSSSLAMCNMWCSSPCSTPFFSASQSLFNRELWMFWNAPLHSNVDVGMTSCLLWRTAWDVWNWICQSTVCDVGCDVNGHLLTGARDVDWLKVTWESITRTCQ